jgi:hypothetical protein
MDLALTLGSFFVGIVVGLTGMGGGALMTPMLVLFFGVPPLAAVSSDLLASAVMKPVGSIVHFRRKTINFKLVAFLCIGSVPAAFCGVFILRSFGSGPAIQAGLQIALGCALVLTALLLTVRAYLRLVERAKSRDGMGQPLPTERPEVPIRILPTIMLGAVGGLIVGMTSVGSGSLIIIGLMLLYPGLKANQLVGTDLAQAVPLVASAAISHAFFGDLQFALTLPLLIGSVPGAFIGAQLSTRLPGGLIRRALAFVLLASGLKLFGISNLVTGIVLLAVLVGAPILWMGIRRRNGFPALASTEMRAYRRSRRAPIDSEPAEQEAPTDERR